MAAPTHFVVKDWHFSQEGRNIHASLLDRKSGKRKQFGLLEKPSYPPQLVPEEFMYKLFISGKGGVGKTSTACSLTGGEAPSTHCETPGLQTWDVYWPAKMVDVDKIVMFHLQFWDAGEHSLKKFDHIMPACKEKADGILFLFSFTDKSSFDDIPQQMSRVVDGQENVCRFVLGTKYPLHKVINKAVKERVQEQKCFEIFIALFPNKRLRLDHHTHSEITLRDLQAFEHQWKLPVLSIKNTNFNAEDMSDVAPVLNYLCDQLWLRDQIMAGKVSAPDFAHEPKISLK